MNTKVIATMAALALLSACAAPDPARTEGAGAAAATAAAATASASRTGGAIALAGLRASIDPARRGATLPDHGELLEYPSVATRTTGAYAWHRTAISEAHAMNAIASGRLRLTTPDGRLLDIVYDRHVEHASGDWTWIGHLAGTRGVQTVLTFGAEGVFGNIGQDAGLPLRLTMRDGLSWLVTTDGAQLAGLQSPAAQARKPDFHVPRLGAGIAMPASAPRVEASAAVPALAAEPTQGPIVDLLVGYTPGMVEAYGSVSLVETRLNALVDLANTAYENGALTGRLRLVHAMQVAYSDTTSNLDALESMSGYEAGSGPATPGAEFASLRQAREQYGADLVTLVRDFRDPEHGNCGIAWLLGGNLQGIAAGEGWDELGYSVVSDGIDQNEQDGKSYFCRDLTLAHEVGHNMGAAHDADTAKGDDGTLDNPDDYGAYTWSFGFKAGATQGNFYTVMAYGESGQTSYIIFSTPDSTFCGGKACGTASADNVRTLETTMPVVSGFRASVFTEAAPPRDDFNGDGVSDILWRNLLDGRNTTWLSADKTTPLALSSLTSQAWHVAGIGDFDGDGIADIYWQNVDTLANAIWKSGNSATRLPTGDLRERGWDLAGVGDFNGDGEDDVVWRNTRDGRNSIWYSGDKADRATIDAVTDTRFHIVGVGDFDGDGRDDILWRNVRTGKNVIWHSGTKAQRETIKSVTDVAWDVVGVGDFDADGREDIMWRHSVEGRNSIWKGGEPIKLAVNSVTDVDWKVERTSDYDGDGKADILWRNATSGKTSIWPSANRNLRRDLGYISVEWMVAP